MIIIAEVKFYISGDVIRDIGIVYFSEVLKGMGVDPILERNCLKFHFIDPDKISDYILNNLIFEVFKNGKKEKLKETMGEIEDLTVHNFIEKLNKSNINVDEKSKLLKDFNNRRLPYIRNSGKYGLNTSLENMESNLKKLVDVVIRSNIGIREINLEKFGENDVLCSICNINKTTKLDINLNKRVDSKLNFLFRGAEKSGFKNNGNSDSNICFECEFLNLMCLLYISLERPVAFAYTNDLTELLYVNYKIMTKRKLCSDKTFYRILAKEKVGNLRIYDFSIDANKGIILRFNSIVDYENILRKIEFFDIIDNYNFTRESTTMKNLGKTMVNNNLLIGLRALLFSNLIVLKSDGATKDLDKVSSLYNIISYIKLLWLIEGKEENEMSEYKKNYYMYSKVGKNLASKMEDDNKKKNFVFKIMQLLKSNDKCGLFQIIMHTLSSYRVPIEDGFVEGIVDSEDLELNTNIGMFVQELMIGGGSKNE